jgi:hypothetical protein
MILSFVKETGRNEEYYVYTIFEGEREIGRFVYLDRNKPGFFSGRKDEDPYTFAYDDREFSIGPGSGGIWPRYQIKEAGNVVGRYKYNDGLISSSAFSKMWIGQDEYRFEAVSAGSLFTREAWSKCRYLLSGSGVEITYDFTPFDSFRFGGYKSLDTSFRGTITTNTDNKLPAFAGIMLVELAMEFIDI